MMGYGESDRLIERQRSDSLLGVDRRREQREHGKGAHQDRLQGRRQRFALIVPDRRQSERPSAAPDAPRSAQVLNIAVGN